MAVYRIIESHVVSEDEFIRKDLGRQLALKSSGGSADRIVLANEAVLDLTAYGGLEGPMADDGTTPLPPIGFGQPMTIDMRHVYTGRVGVKNFDGTGDIAVVSGVKDWSVFKASARALNFVAIHQGKHSNLTGPTALTDGTRVVAYQKAVVSKQVIVSFEITAAGKQDGIAQQLGRAFTASAGIPLFLPYAGVLLGAGQLLPLVGKLANALVGTSSPWSQTAEINFGLPGTTPSVAELRLVAAAGADFSAYRFKAGSGLVDSAGTAYAGDEPYAVIAIYGGADPDLEAFTPAVAGADLLKRFYEAQSGAGAVLDDVVELMKLASDVKFRDQAVALKRQLDAATAGSDLAKQLDAKLKAAVANISDPALKP